MVVVMGLRSVLAECGSLGFGFACGFFAFLVLRSIGSSSLLSAIAAEVTDDDTECAFVLPFVLEGFDVLDLFVVGAAVVLEVESSVDAFRVAVAVALRLDLPIWPSLFLSAELLAWTALF